MTTRVLVAASARPVLHRLCLALGAAGYRVLPALDVAGALRIWLADPDEPPDVVLTALDPALTDPFALWSVLRTRDQGDPGPLVVALDRPALADERRLVRALGEVDVVLAPTVADRELLAWIRSLLARRLALSDAAPVGGPVELRFDGLRIDRRTRRAYVDQAECPTFSPRDWELLDLLACNAPRPLAGSEIVRTIWGRLPGVNATALVRLYVRRVRQKLGDDLPPYRWLRVDPNYGYRFAPPLRVV